MGVLTPESQLCTYQGEAMRVLVTGVQGFIGSHVLVELLGQAPGCGSG